MQFTSARYSFLTELLSLDTDNQGKVKKDTKKKAQTTQGPRQAAALILNYIQTIHKKPLIGYPLVSDFRIS